MVEQTPGRAMLALLLLCVICVSGSAEGQMSLCEAVFRVKRNTVVKGTPEQPLTVTCPLKWDNCDSEPTGIISWCKIITHNECVQLNLTHRVDIHQERSLRAKNEIVSHLKFHSVTKHDEGLYRCGIAGNISAVSHTLNVSVSGLEDKDDGRNHDTTTSSNEISQENTPPLEWLPYVYICVGIVTLVGVVMLLSFLGLHGCKRKSPGAHQGTLQSQKTEQAGQTQCPTRRSSARVTPSPNVPKRDRSLRCQPTQSPVLPRPPYETEHLKETPLHGLLTLPRAPPSLGSTPNQELALLRGSHDNPRDRRPSQVLYAALDHLAPRDASRTLPTVSPQDEFSEYASIRIS